MNQNSSRQSLCSQHEIKVKILYSGINKPLNSITLRIIYFTFFVLFSFNGAQAQLDISSIGSEYSVTFDETVTGVCSSEFNGTGFTPTPSSGQLDSDAFAITGFSNGSLSFGGTKTTGDFARGSSSGGVGTGGIYAFDIGSGDVILGIQPGGSDFTPGTITLRLENTTGSDINELSITYKIHVYNDQNRSNSLNFSYSSDDVSYTDVASLNYSTPGAASGSPEWASTSKSATLSSISFSNGSYFYIRWTGNDDGGSGSRDEYGINDLTIDPQIEGLWKTSAASTDWATSSNWDNGSVPNSSTDVTIPAGASNWPEIPGDVGTPSECNNLTIATGATLTVPVDKCLTVNGNLSSSGTLIVSSTSSGNGSIIVDGTASGTTTVQRWVEAYSGDDDGWHLISSAVDDMAISGSDFVPGGSDDLYSWDEDDYIWRNYSGGSFPYSNFNNGVGFLVAYQASATKAFSGTLNVDDITFSNLTYTSGTGDGWHLLGNPYASALTWNDGNWTLTNVGGVAKVYDESAGNYVSISANGFIPSTNGFFVQVSSSTNTTTIPKAARAHNATNNYKSTNVVPETLNLTVSNDGNGFSDITSVGFRDDANTYFDWDFDSHKLFGQVTAPQLWTVSEDEEYSINNLPHVFESLVVPLNFQAGINTDYEISADGLESFFINSEILLEDLFTNQIINLREQPNYSFYGNVDDANERFLLHFYGITSVDNTNDNTFANIYTSNNILYLKHDEMPKDKSIVGVFSTTGQKVLDFTIEPDILNRVELNLPAGIYIVSLSSKLGVISEKVVIN